MRRRFPAGLAALLLLVSASQAKAPKREHDITVDDYFTLATISDCVISPDGEVIAYTEGRWQQSTDDRKTDLWMLDTKGATVRRLTSDRANDRSPQWAPDNKTIYFLGNRQRAGEKRPPFDGKTQVWKIGTEGGEPSAVTKVEGGVIRFQLAHDGKSLWYGTESDHNFVDEWKQLREQFKDVDYGHGVHKVSQVWRLNLQTWREEKVIDDPRYIHDMLLSRDGNRLAMITAPDDRVIHFEGRSHVHVYDADTKSMRIVPDDVYHKKAPSPYGWLEHLAWSADGKRLAFNVILDGYPAEIVAAVWEGREITTFTVPPPKGTHVKGYGSPLAWAGQGEKEKLYFLVEQKGLVHLCNAVVAREESRALLIDANAREVVHTFGFSDDGSRGAAVQNDEVTFEEVYLLEMVNIARQNIYRVRYGESVNPQTETWKLPKLSVFSWKAPDGTPVEGVLELPPDYKEGQKLPLVVAIHGGPTTADYFGLQFWIYGRTLLPAKGYAVLCPNYRGSTGYGDKFLTDLLGHENDLDVKDILAGVDALIEKGIADPERLGVMGWSNGGYLTNCLISQTTRFKAASCGAGIVDTVMEWGANDEPAYAIVFKKGFPWNASENYHKASPTYALDKVRTPTLIHVGGSDERCPPSQSRMLYRALKEYNKVPAELLVYPGESHGVMKYKNRKAKMEWDLAWFDRYLLGKKAK
jgi:dipeptidyl aminopeptidase/acylaminoacyl peptidase